MSDWMNPNQDPPKVISGADIIKAIKLAEAEHMKPPKEKWWSPAIWKEKATYGAEVIKKVFIGIRVKF
jgi:hypothetical protein